MRDYLFLVDFSTFSNWVEGCKLNEKTVLKLEEENLDDFKTLKLVAESELKRLNLTIGQHALLKKAVKRLKSEKFF